MKDGKEVYFDLLNAQVCQMTTGELHFLDPDISSISRVKVFVSHLNTFQHLVCRKLGMAFFKVIH